VAAHLIYYLYGGGARTPFIYFMLYMAAAAAAAAISLFFFLVFAQPREDQGLTLRQGIVDSISTYLYSFRD